MPITREVFYMMGVEAKDKFFQEAGLKKRNLWLFIAGNTHLRLYIRCSTLSDISAVLFFQCGLCFWTSRPALLD